MNIAGICLFLGLSFASAAYNFGSSTGNSSKRHRDSSKRHRNNPEPHFIQVDPQSGGKQMVIIAIPADKLYLERQTIVIKQTGVKTASPEDLPHGIDPESISESLDATVYLPEVHIQNSSNGGGGGRSGSPQMVHSAVKIPQIEVHGVRPASDFDHHAQRQPRHRDGDHFDDPDDRHPQHHHQNQPGGSYY